MKLQNVTDSKQLVNDFGEETSRLEGDKLHWFTYEINK